MNKKPQRLKLYFGLALWATLLGCQPQAQKPAENTQALQLTTQAEQRLDIYQPVRLQVPLDSLSEQQRQMLSVLIDAADIMDALFWQQAYGNKDALLSRIDNPKGQAFAAINYGPWDRLAGDKPLFDGINAKPPGAAFYPEDMTKAEFEQANLADKTGLYSMVRRNSQGSLVSIPYSEYFFNGLTRAATLLEEAAELAEDPQFAEYLQLRAQALLSDDYLTSDMAWMEMKNNPIELVYGPIETYEDQLYGYRAAFEAYVLLKDKSWSERLAKFADYLPQLQQDLPVADEYKQEMPGTDADLNAYDVLYYAGHANAGGKTIAINLPNDERVQLAKGTRRLQLKNAMQAKFEHILLPITEQLITPEQRANVTFEAFFANTMFHEVAHGLGIKNTLDGQGTVREALKEHASALEEGKADILGIYMVRQLLAEKAITEGSLQDYYVTFMASIFRSVRFGASSAHGKANMVRFNYFANAGAFSKDDNGFYRVDMDKMSTAIDSLSEKILTLQGDGNYQGVSELVAQQGVIKAALQADLDKLTQANIPVDIVFEQGKQVLGL